MSTEGLKRLIPFEKWDEVVATANHADEALDYVQGGIMNVVISSACLTRQVLKLVGEMKGVASACAILLSGYQKEFDYVKENHEPQCCRLP